LIVTSFRLKMVFEEYGRIKISVDFKHITFVRYSFLSRSVFFSSLLCIH
jgi:hypothetical protein